MKQIEHVVNAQCKLGEGPVWHPQEQALYWLDIYHGILHRYDPLLNAHERQDLGLITSAMGVRAGGGFVMATKKGFAFWDTRLSQFTFLNDPDPDPDVETRFNDGKTDPQGRFWAGKMSSSYENSLFRLDSDCSVRRMESKIGISNGLGWSPDERMFYFTDSQAKTIYAYDFDAPTGAISNRRVFAVSEAGFPDGLAIDVDGYIWSARWGGWKIVRYDPQGRIVQEVPVPVEFPTSCAFGGPERKDLYITSAWVEIRPENRAKQPLAGDVFRLAVDVPGLPEPLFRG